MNWLVKEEPDHYGFEDLLRDKQTSWSGVKNPLAQKHLRSIRKGDRVLFYHTGRVKAVVGTARAVSDPYPDPADKGGKLYAVDIAPGRRLKTPVPLAAFKADPFFASFPLVRMPRLSVMPVTDEQWERIEHLGKL
jgi:predicted RNA-binding protein with PUA-like domain